MSEIDELVSKIMKQMQQGTTTATPSNGSQQEMTASDYPLYGKHRDLVTTPSGKNLDNITVDSVTDGQIKPEEFRITPNSLRLQGQIAGSAGRPAIQKNFQRAAELTKVPDERLLEMYNSLRPFRSTKQELLDIASELRTKYQANVCAAWFEEAADYYESRKKLKGDN